MVAETPDVVETSAGRFWLEDEILRFEAREGSEQSRQDAEESMRVFAKLAKGRRRPTVMVITGVKRLSREARAIYTSAEAGKTFTATAIVVASSTVARALFNFVIIVGRPPYPARMFDTVDDAVEWARKHTLPAPG